GGDGAEVGRLVLEVRGDGTLDGGGGHRAGEDRQVVPRAVQAAREVARDPDRGRRELRVPQGGDEIVEVLRQHRRVGDEELTVGERRKDRRGGTGARDATDRRREPLDRT